MTYRIILNREGKEDLVFKGVPYFLAEPGRVKIRIDSWRDHSVDWRTVDEVTGLILHEEKEDE